MCDTAGCLLTNSLSLSIKVIVSSYMNAALVPATMTPSWQIEVGLDPSKVSPLAPAGLLCKWRRPLWESLVNDVAFKTVSCSFR